MTKLQELKNVLLNDEFFMAGPVVDPDAFIEESKTEAYEIHIKHGDKLMIDFMKGLTLTGAEFFDYLDCKTEIIDKFMSGGWDEIYDVYWKSFGEFVNEVLSQVREDD